MKLITKESTLSSLLALGVIARASAITIVRSSAIPSSSSDHVRIEKGLDMVELLKRHNKNATSEYFIESSLEEVDESVPDEGYNSCVSNWEKQSGSHSDDNSYDMYMKSCLNIKNKLYSESIEVETNDDEVEMESTLQEMDTYNYFQVSQAYTSCVMNVYRQGGTYSDVRSYDIFISCLSMQSVDQVDRVSYEAYSSCFMKFDEMYDVNIQKCLYSPLSSGVETKDEKVELDEVHVPSQESSGVEERDDEVEMGSHKATDQLELHKKYTPKCVQLMTRNAQESFEDDFEEGIMTCLKQKYMKYQHHDFSLDPKDYDLKDLIGSKGTDQVESNGMDQMEANDVDEMESNMTSPLII